LTDVAIPNTNIASNLGPQVDPKDIDAVEMQRGSYAADFGDRTYGVFDVLPRTGFERNNEAELTVSAGNSLSNRQSNQFRRAQQTLLRITPARTGTARNLGLQTPRRRLSTTPRTGTGDLSR